MLLRRAEEPDATEVAERSAALCVKVRAQYRSLRNQYLQQQKKATKPAPKANPKPAPKANPKQTNKRKREVKLDKNNAPKVPSDGDSDYEPHTKKRA